MEELMKIGHQLGLLMTEDYLVGFISPAIDWTDGIVYFYLDFLRDIKKILTQMHFLFLASSMLLYSFSCLRTLPTLMLYYVLTQDAHGRIGQAYSLPNKAC